ncbi:conserved hypothetical protein [Burkholderia mallei PRL-20]|uniref:Uncharacterized protein n=1 Tax=Burkholderia mallei (strain NCTC 10229) TaxID=412022 RepID=A2S3X6_BURM9|nr:hypothetical protein BMASAVP1_A1217 [Burkholderia mallei SAVP1]ABN01307.1 hypothetical protein BMA10229_A0650 [Burkholderia mallei NCTC 10229]ABO05538.1 hypothetical protein BMA10247_0503 [Burkholderia mallei NCTC 10247]EDU07842.1 hypothetical protein BURPS1655_A2345 [Burkholderia pseudomallei 1655]EEH25323.1 conserved hypothetical protein [Burkholderia pseudomallei Pakistan 9]EEP88172.1 conserved hypothetical protein [Burkholderia mallei GB8 horse 4]EES44044.1 conserved hypothetical prote
MAIEKPASAATSLMVGVMKREAEACKRFRRRDYRRRR